MSTVSNREGGNFMALQRIIKKLSCILFFFMATWSSAFADGPKSSCYVDFVVAGAEQNVNGFIGVFTSQPAYKDSDCKDVSVDFPKLKDLFPSVKNFKQSGIRCIDPDSELIPVANKIMAEQVPVVAYVVLSYPCNDPATNCISRKCPDGYQKCAKDKFCKTLC